MTPVLRRGFGNVPHNAEFSAKSELPLAEGGVDLKVG